MAERFQHQQLKPTSATRQVVKATTAVTLGGSLLMVSGLLLVGTVIGLTMATPVMVLFSPVLVPAVITVGMIITGFVASGGFGVAAVTVLTMMYKSIMSGKNVPQQLASKARDLRENLGQQQQPRVGAQAS